MSEVQSKIDSTNTCLTSEELIIGQTTPPPLESRKDNCGSTDRPTDVATKNVLRRFCVTYLQLSFAHSVAIDEDLVRQFLVEFVELLQRLRHEEPYVGADFVAHRIVHGRRRVISGRKEASSNEWYSWADVCVCV